jgi:hypothetical protein
METGISIVIYACVQCVLRRSVEGASRGASRLFGAVSRGLRGASRF